MNLKLPVCHSEGRFSGPRNLLSLVAQRMPGSIK